MRHAVSQCAPSPWELRQGPGGELRVEIISPSYVRTNFADGVTDPSAISRNLSWAIILRRDRNARHTTQSTRHTTRSAASQEYSPILCSMVCHRRGPSLVARRAAPSGGPVDRPTDDRGAHPAPVAGLDSQHSVSRTLQIHSAQPNLARSPARCGRCGGRALLRAPWVRLARDPNRCRRRCGR